MFHPRGLRARFPRLLPPVHHQTDVASVFPGWTPSSPARVRPLCSALVRPAHMCTPTHRKSPRDPKSLKGFHETSALHVPVVCLNATRVLLPDPSTNHDLAHVYPNPEHHQFRGPVLRGSVFRREIPGEWSRVQSGSVPLKQGRSWSPTSP